MFFLYLSKNNSYLVYRISYVVKKQRTKYQIRYTNDELTFF